MKREKWRDTKSVEETVKNSLQDTEKISKKFKVRGRPSKL